MISPEFLFGNIPQKQSKYFLSIIHQIGKKKNFNKGKTIIQKGSHPTFFFYIISGAFKTSIIINNKVYILGFTLEGDIDCCPTSVLKNASNNFSIEAVFNSEVLICNFKDFQQACTAEKYGSITNNILTNYISILENSLIESISLTAEQRYHNLLQRQPTIIERIPLQFIAAYLGITQERLSRIRKNANN